jgi:hypothetical protein
MLTLFQRTAVIPVWLIVFGLFALGSSMTLSASVLVAVLGTVALTIMLILLKAPPSTIAEVLHDVDASRTDVMRHQADRS